MKSIDSIESVKSTKLIESVKSAESIDLYNSAKSIIIFTDGSVPNNQGTNRKGGIGVFFGTNYASDISLSLQETKDFKVTNQVCELLACIKGIESINKIKGIIKPNIKIYTDSMYVVNIINCWAKKWEKNNWKKADNKSIQNEHLIKQLYFLSNKYDVKYIHVKAHRKEPDKMSNDYFIWYGNYMADKLAVSASTK